MAIAQLAFNEFIKSAAGETAKKAVGGAIDKLRSAIKERFQGQHDKAETAIATIESSDNTTEVKNAALNKLAVYLDDEMDDVPFADNLQQLAQQVINIQNQNSSTRIYDNHGRDRINVEHMTGNQKFGGSMRCPDSTTIAGAINLISRI